MTPRHRLLVLPVLALGATCLLASPAHAAQDRDCPDFSSQAEAQAVLDQDPSDPEDLDRDEDGTACETTTYSGSGAGSSDTSTTPTGGVAAGGGGMARSESLPVLPVSGAAVGTLLIGAGVLAVARRRPGLDD